MIYKELERIVIENRRLGQSEMYIRNLLKEYLQIYVLNCIYTDQEYNKKLIFTGGTCLRHFYDLPRLSEDLDFDYNQDINSEELLDIIEDFFVKKYIFTDISTSLKQKGNQILLKFPVLKKLKLASDSESEMLYLKIDLQKNPSKIYDSEISSKSIQGFNFVALHYDLPTLMAGKISAILTRERFVGKDDRKTVKGRDYYDLLWYLKKSVVPNIDRISDILDEKLTIQEVKKRLDKKVYLLIEKYRNDFESDLLPLIKNGNIVPIYVNNYIEEYKRDIKYLENP
jgi:predicted nucleotidyltransferase component of viral defense system